MSHPDDLSRLSIELVPATAWWSNVRSNVTRAQWEKCKRLVKERSGSRCEICGGVGSRYPVDCHEIWHYDDETQIQTLVGLIALCPRCHEVKHLGRAFAVGNAQRAIEHLMAVNGWDPERTEEYVVAAFALHDQRSRIEWTLNIDYLYDEGDPDAMMKIMGQADPEGYAPGAWDEVRAAYIGGHLSEDAYVCLYNAIRERPLEEA